MEYFSPACVSISLVESCKVKSGHIQGHPNKHSSDLEGDDADEQKCYTYANFENDPHACPDYTD